MAKLVQANAVSSDYELARSLVTGGRVDDWSLGTCTWDLVLA